MFSCSTPLSIALSLSISLFPVITWYIKEKMKTGNFKDWIKMDSEPVPALSRITRQTALKTPVNDEESLLVT